MASSRNLSAGNRRALSVPVRPVPVVPRWSTFERLRNRGDVFRRVSAAAAGYIDQSRARKLSERSRHIGRSEIESRLRKRIRQARIRITRDRNVGLLGKLAQEGIHQVWSKRAVEADRQWIRMLDRVPESLGGLR